jgi:hypothetical protein
MVQVGIYWAQVKGRFNGGTKKTSYLKMKYGMRWRAHFLLARFKAPPDQFKRILAIKKVSCKNKDISLQRYLAQELLKRYM